MGPDNPENPEVTPHNLNSQVEGEVAVESQVEVAERDRMIRFLAWLQLNRTQVSYIRCN